MHAPAGTQVRVAHLLRQVGLPVLVGHHRQRRRAAHLDVGLAPHRAGRAVAGQQVLRLPEGGFAGGHPAGVDLDAFRRFAVLREFVAEEDLADLALACVVQQFLFHRVLRLDDLPARRMADVGLGVGAAPLMAGH